MSKGKRHNMIVGILSMAILALLALFLAQRTGVLGGRG